MKALVRDFTEDLKLSDVLKFFDVMVTKDMKKLSIQEYSKNVKEIPTSTPKVRTYQSVLMKNNDDLRNKKKFVELNKIEE